MTFVPFDKSGRQAYRFDTRSLKTKIRTFLMRRIWIPLFGEIIVGKTFENVNIIRKATVFRNCTFRHCPFVSLRDVFILGCSIYFEGQNLNIGHMSDSTIKNCVLFPNTRRT